MATSTPTSRRGVARPRRVRRAARRPPPGRAGHGGARPQLAVRRAARSTSCCATATCWSSARSRPAPALDHGTPARGRHRRQARRGWAGWPCAGSSRTTSGRQEIGSTWSRCSARGGGRRWSSTCGGWSDAVRHDPHHRAHGALGHLIDVQADVSPGQVGTTLVGRPDASLNEAPRPLPDGDAQHRARLAVHPADHRSCCRRPTCPSAAPTSTSPSRRRARPPPAARRGRPGRHRVHRRAHPRPAACGPCPACCRWCWPRLERGIRRVFVPEPQAQRRPWCPT